MSTREYFLIFDTNVLYQDYKTKADFCSFSFNATYENVIGLINQLDIYENVIVAIPNVVWNEMKKQIIDAHTTKLDDYKSYIKKWKFPEFSIKENSIDEYSTFIVEKIEEYNSDICSGINKVIELPLPSDGRFKRIVRRAYDKEPPFEGKEKKSDKGFKDVLIWESILEFVSLHPSAEIIFYSKDNGFKEHLNKEFEELFSDAHISICYTENDVKLQLEQWAKEIDIYAYQPIADYKEHQEFICWLESGDCTIQLIDRNFDLIEKSRIITSTSIKVVDYDNIQVTPVAEEKMRYSVDATLEVTYSVKNKMTVHETIEVNMEVESFDDTVFSIEDVYKTNGEEESEESEA